MPGLRPIAVLAVALVACGGAVAVARPPGHAARDGSSADSSTHRSSTHRSSTHRSSTPGRSTIGSKGSGDPYFPLQGNGGYNVKHYGLRLQYQPSSQELRATARITAVATKRLTRFDLDLRDRLHVTLLSVDGAAAKYAQPARLEQELVVTPAQALRKGRPFTVVVRYEGKPRAVHDPDGSLDGWIHTRDGVFVASEPQGSPSWFPVNDTPNDKASYRVATTVPKGLHVVGNGRLVGKHTAHGRTTWTWRITKPISSYLVTATIGKFHITKGKTGKGVPYYIAVDPNEKSADKVLTKLPEIIDYYTNKYGRYPFGSVGAIVDHAHYVGYALETATRPLFDRAPTAATLAHELAHQWFGDTVTCTQWRDIWINEGFAQFNTWLWEAHHGGASLDEHQRRYLRSGAEIDPPPGNPGSAKQIFAGSIYDRGAAALVALHDKVGAAVFFRILRGWVQREHHYGNGTVAQFTSYAQRISHRNLHHLFHKWLYRKGKP